jgi:hypothetical protein
VRQINAQNGWGPSGTYTERGRIGTQPTWDDPFPFSAPENAAGPGHFSVEYEIRRVLLPDLKPTGIEVRRPVGSTVPSASIPTCPPPANTI